MQIELTGFLGRNAAPFMEELWTLLLSAQESPVGIPAAILEEKRAEIQRTQACGVWRVARESISRVGMMSGRCRGAGCSGWRGGGGLCGIALP